MTIAKEAWVFVLPFAVVAAALFALRYPRSAVVCLALGLAVMLFFRVPTRRYSGAADDVLAPANGRITEIALIEEPELGPGRHHRIVTFLSVFNIHVQRSPVAGKVVASVATPGRKLAAFRPEAGDVNENHWSVIERPNGDRLGVRQIAGLLARRVVCYLEPDQVLERGELIGLIKFGSRVDLLLPADYEILVAKGDRLVEGETLVAKAGGAEPPPAAAVRSEAREGESGETK